MTTLNVERYSRDVIDAYRQNVRHMDHDTARATTIHTSATAAREAGAARIDDAARLSRTAIDDYARQRNNGVSHERAADTVTRDMAQRFDSRAREKRHERSREAGIGF